MLADALLFPSFYEGFGLPALEAQALHTPVITSINNSIGEHVGQYALFVDPYNVSHITAALNLVLKKEAHLTKTPQIHTHNLTWKNTAQKTLEALNRDYSIVDA